MTSRSANPIRASKACQRCHQRRVKCDASRTGTICTRCRQKGFTDCQLIESRRGTYSRQKWKEKQKERSQERGGEEIPSTSHTPITVEAITGPVNLGNNRTDCASHDPGSRPLQAEALQDLELSTDSPEQSNSMGTIDELHIATPSGSVPASTQHNEPSWGTFFDYFLEHRKDHKDLLDKATITYIGESFPLSIVLEDFNKGGRLLLHHPEPPAVSAAVTERPTENHPLHISTEDITFLRSKGTFEAPTEATRNVLVEVFFEFVYPIYPILNRSEFLQQHRAREIPWLLLHAVCFMAATYAPPSVIHKAGFSSQKQARDTYYNRAQYLFNFGYERDKIVALQSAILLTFWGGNPNDFRNHFTWIGHAVTIAETLGMHRSTAATNLPQKDKSLLKRLWWVLVLRDAHCGALFGRPLRINLSQCDAEMLEPQDFEDARNPIEQLHSLYQIQVSRLALILREAITSRFHHASLSQPDNDTAVFGLHAQLQEWRAQVPRELDWLHRTSDNIFSQTLSLLHDHHTIFIHLRKPPLLVNSQRTSDASYAVLQSASHRIASLGSSIVTRALSRKMPHEAFTAIFAAEVVLVTQLQHSSDLSVTQLSKAELNLCQMVMFEAREFWDAAPWVMQLFDTLINKLQRDEEFTAALTLRSFNNNLRSNFTPIHDSGEASHGRDMSDSGAIPTPVYYSNRHENSDRLGGWDSWPVHDLFSSFLDNSGGGLADLSLFGSDFDTFTGLNI